ncbi:hypothetical protein N657DRAFT_376271 [Parathielavia appendiculata]|uniref:Uncharacterized protein n=1 Tax=Parathielavia appendiculata TaxID=2587402 RepID=A0AAN6U0F9_9PEZI|nr:hypothetical protein N657DRAFT_376271 [Parathielavia appendiculata]
MMMHPADAFGKQLLEISQAIMRRFLPKDEHSKYHAVCERFWGSVDEAVRQIRWSTEPSGALWTIRDFDTMSGTAGGSGGVTAKSRMSGARLVPQPQHMLRHHLHSSISIASTLNVPLENRPQAEQRTGRTMTLAMHTSSRWPTPTSNEPEIEKIAKEFINHLSDFSGSLNKIQWLVATNSQGIAQYHDAIWATKKHLTNSS